MEVKIMGSFKKFYKYTDADRVEKMQVRIIDSYKSLQDRFKNLEHSVEIKTANDRFILNKRDVKVLIKYLIRAL